MTSLSGLQSGDFTDIDVLYTININGDAGSNNQVIKSDGENSSWADPHDLLDLEDLTAGTGIAYTSGTTYDGSLARTITTANVPNSALTNSTISGVALGSNLANLTKGTNITFSSGTTYNGSSAITISSTFTDTTYSAGNGLDLTGTTFSADLKAGSGLAITSTEIDLVDIPNSALANDDITIGSTSIALGASSTSVAGITSFTMSDGASTTLTGSTYTNDPTTASYIDITQDTNIVSPYFLHDVYDPSSLTKTALTTSYVAIFSNNLSNAFTAKATTCCIELLIFNYSGTANRWLYLRLNDDYGSEWSGGTYGGGYGTGTRNTERFVNYTDETDRNPVRQTWYLQGLTIGTSYTINPAAKTSATTNSIYAGGSYPACILRGYYLPTSSG